MNRKIERKNKKIEDEEKIKEKIKRQKIKKNEINKNNKKIEDKEKMKETKKKDKEDKE